LLRAFPNPCGVLKRRFCAAFGAEAFVTRHRWKGAVQRVTARLSSKKRSWLEFRVKMGSLQHDENKGEGPSYRLLSFLWFALKKTVLRNSGGGIEL
jgi:hypothetical protein